ncbi:MAG: hypothetical protein JO149_00015, partial [Gammaproteobacteria bacterium]|nr:hypothetical protein [Gammaproteobacteria bacterium]
NKNNLMPSMIEDTAQDNNNNLPPWLARMKQILKKVVDRKRLLSYDDAKRNYIQTAMALVEYAIDHHEIHGQEYALDMFRIFMVCCFQNKNGNNSFFNSLQTSTGLALEKELRVIDHNNPHCPTSVLRGLLFGKQYGERNKILPNYSDMVNSLYKKQITEYPNHSGDDKNTIEIDLPIKEQIKKVKFAPTPTHKVDVLKTASLLISETKGLTTFVPLTVALVGRPKLVEEYIFKSKALPAQKGHSY